MSLKKTEAVSILERDTLGNNHLWAHSGSAFQRPARYNRHDRQAFRGRPSVTPRCPPMRLLDLTLPTPAENLALDEALLAQGSGDVLRVWEPAVPMVVVGRGSRIEEEVNLAACGRLGVPVLRRVSGGATIVAGPGCLMVAVVLDTASDPRLATIDGIHQYVLGRQVQALASLAPTLRVAGTSDLVVTAGSQAEPQQALKVSGNSLRVARGRVLYHGTLLNDFDLSLVGKLLREPPRQPEYRERRTHERFVTNLGVPRGAIVDALVNAWSAHEPSDVPPRPVIDRLVAERYGDAGWNLSR